MYQTLWDTAKAVLRGKFIASKCPHQKAEKIKNPHPNITIIKTREARAHKFKSQQNTINN